MHVQQEQPQAAKAYHENDFGTSCYGFSSSTQVLLPKTPRVAKDFPPFSHGLPGCHAAKLQQRDSMQLNSFGCTCVVVSSWVNMFAHTRGHILPLAVADLRSPDCSRDPGCTKGAGEVD